ncbi:MAG: hypothetical protein IPM29_20580 [Planctomycetes bacterium]|nr:hypothetical protein [Planctomycetota bacterium]
MMRSLLAVSLAAVLAAPAFAQAQDVGLTSDGGLLTVIYGQICGPVGCQPFPAGAVGANSTRNFVHYAAPRTPFAIVLGLPGACARVRGIDNVLLLAPPLVTLGSGSTSAPPIVPTPCGQGLAHASLTIPAVAPVGLVFRVQSIGMSNSGAFAFGPALEIVVR